MPGTQSRHLRACRLVRVMKVTKLADPTAFRVAVGEFLLCDEVRHNLMLGLLGTLIDRPQVYPTFDLWLV